MRREKDRSDAVHFRSERLLRINGEWYFSTREKQTVGPFVDKAGAQKKLELYLSEISRSEADHSSDNT